MKITTQKLLMVAMILFCCNTYTHAQDNDMLAKIAFESAEEALAAGNTHEAYEELNKVDSLLNKVTPKSLYLRVQLFNQAVKEDPSNLESAISVCNRYLALSKSFNIGEDKLMEVTKLRINLEKQKVEWDRKKDAEERFATRVNSFLDSLYKSCHFSLSMTEEDFIKGNTELVKQMEVKKEGIDKWYTNYKNNEGFTGPVSIVFKNGKIALYDYRLKTAGRNDTTIEQEFLYKLKPSLQSVFSEEMITINSPDTIKLEFILGKTFHVIRYELGGFKKAKTLSVTIQSVVIP